MVISLSDLSCDKSRNRSQPSAELSDKKDMTISWPNTGPVTANSFTEDLLTVRTPPQWYLVWHWWYIPQHQQSACENIVNHSLFQDKKSKLHCWLEIILIYFLSLCSFYLSFALSASYSALYCSAVATIKALLYYLIWYGWCPTDVSADQYYQMILAVCQIIVIGIIMTDEWKFNKSRNRKQKQSWNNSWFDTFLLIQCTVIYE